MATPGTSSSASARISNVLAKYVMAVTGIVFALFVLVHMYGNLKVYSGPEAFNTYALFLRNLFYPLFPYEGFLWVFRAVLLICLVGHVGCAVLLTSRAKKARGKHKRRGLKGYKSFTARTMPVTGLVLLFFIIFHILDLTAGVGVAPSSFQHGTPTTSYAYENLVASFQRPLVSFFYLAAMIILFLHLAHGLWAAIYDFGVTVSERARSWAILIAGLYGLVVVLGNISIPIAVLAGIVQ